ncbi:L,D-transpeptidase [Aureimonas ureilytica]|uniref:L,D-transpeptidase n=1 Tax=Aureimonas ureilytica TaxID=401562 RepID=UPI0003826615|nr:L,D-transpeptidase [Aureimonas ureilytica]
MLRFRALAACAALVLSTMLGSVAAEAAAGGRQETLFLGDYEPGTIVVFTGARQLFLVTGHERALKYDIAVGKPSEQWFGTSWVSKKRLNPIWVPTPSMREAKPTLPTSVGPGPSNPLGKRAMNLGWGTYRIHGTNSPNSIGSAASAGCFRMRNADVEDLFERVHVGAQVVVLQ